MVRGMLSEPPVTMTFAIENVLESSVSVKMIVAVCPELREVALDVIVTLGATASIAMVDGSRLPRRFWLPARSVNFPAATETVANVLEGSGVKTAVYSVEEIVLKLPSEPLIAVMSEKSKSGEAALSVKVIRAVWLTPRFDLSVMIEMVGWTVLTPSESWAVAILKLLLESEKAPAAMLMVAAPVKPAVGVRVVV